VPGRAFSGRSTPFTSTETMWYTARSENRYLFSAREEGGRDCERAHTYTSSPGGEVRDRCNCMDIYLDTASVADIKKWLAMGLVDGITTNPSIMLRDGFFDLESGAKEIAGLIKPRPVSVEVTSDVTDEMLRQARVISKWATNIVIKIPQLTRDGTPCYAVMRKLEEEGIPVNATLAMNFGQVMLSAKAGASYISIFVGRIGDEGGDAVKIVKDSVDWLKLWGYRSRIIAASIRSVPDFLASASAGAHIITTPPNFLQVMTDNKCSREGVRRFIADAEAAMAKMGRGK